MFLMGWLVTVLPHGCCCSDVKPENILALVEDGTRLIKVLLADFGEAKHLTQSITHVSAVRRLSRTEGMLLLYLWRMRRLKPYCNPDSSKEMEC